MSTVNNDDTTVDLSQSDDENSASTSHQSSKNSWVWSHFKDKEVTDKKKKETYIAKACIHCPVQYDMRKSAGSTGALIKHMKSKHPGKLPFAESKETKPTALFNFLGRASQQNADDFRAKLVKWIVCSDQPFLESNNAQFREMIKSANPNIKVPDRHSVVNDIMKKYTEWSEVLTDKFKSSETRVSLTIDAWTSPSHADAFCAITCHFIDSKWNFQNFLLDFIKLNGSHSGQNLADAIFSTLTKYGLTDKVLAIVTDNATNNDTMCSELGNVLENFSAEHNRIRCLAHVMHLAATDFLSGLKSVAFESEEDLDAEGIVLNPVNKLRKLIVKIRASPQRRERFFRACDSAEVDKLMLMLDVKTRWNSTYTMIERAFILREAIDIFCAGVPELRELSIEETDWTILEDIKEFLKIFNHATKFLCQEKHPTVQFAIPIYNYLIDKSEEFRSTASDTLKVPVKSALHKLQKYYDLTGAPLNLTYSSAIILDPTLKTAFFRDRNWTQGATKAVKELVKTEYSTHYQKENNEIESLADEDKTDNPLLQHLYKKRKVDNRSELDQYISSAVVSYETNGVLCDRLLWWKNNASQYPTLSKMAKDYLAVPATSSPSERAFSGAKLVITDQRNKLNPETIQALMCLRDWFNIADFFYN